ncbi:MAG: short chain dehydrogenase [Cytophagaceae bacterium]|nr:short chain dehydrogenase [Cytophagaceae bacterium]
MKIVIIGGTGTIGQRLVTHFEQEDKVIVAGRSTPTLCVDIKDSDSIRQLFDKIGKVDAVICVAGEAKWDSFDTLTEADYYIGIKSKLMGQVNLVRIGRDYINPKGSITLTTGILADDPVAKTSSAAMVNGAIHSFVKAAALELASEIRINVVSSGMVADAYEKYKTYFPGHNPIPMTKVVNAYVRSVKGLDNGQVIRVYD